MINKTQRCRLILWDLFITEIKCVRGVCIAYQETYCFSFLEKFIITIYLVTILIQKQNASDRIYLECLAVLLPMFPYLTMILVNKAQNFLFWV